MRKGLADLLRRSQDTKQKKMEELKELLCKDTACFILITCNKPDGDGKMDVEMSYEGDRELAGYLAQYAQDYFGNEE